MKTLTLVLLLAFATLASCVFKLDIDLDAHPHRRDLLEPGTQEGKLFLRHEDGASTFIDYRTAVRQDITVIKLANYADAVAPIHCNEADSALTLYLRSDIAFHRLVDVSQWSRDHVIVAGREWKCGRAAATPSYAYLRLLDSGEYRLLGNHSGIMYGMEMVRALDLFHIFDMAYSHVHPQDVEAYEESYKRFDDWNEVRMDRRDDWTLLNENGAYNITTFGFNYNESSHHATNQSVPIYSYNNGVANLMCEDCYITGRVYMQLGIKMMWLADFSADVAFTFKPNVFLDASMFFKVAAKHQVNWDYTCNLYPRTLLHEVVFTISAVPVYITFDRQVDINAAASLYEETNYDNWRSISYSSDKRS